MKQNIKDLQENGDQPFPIFCDNTFAINIYKNHVMHSKMNCIPIKYHFLQEQFIDQTIRLEYIPTKEQIENIFKKPLIRECFEYLR